MDRIFAFGAVKKTDDGFHERLKDVISRVGGLKNAADLTGYSSDQVAKWRDGVSRAPFQPLMILAQAASVTLDWLATGAEQPQMPPDSEEDYVAVSLLNVQAGSGDGIVNGEVEIIDTLPFSRALLKELGVSPEDAHFIRNKGDSNEPTIPDGAIILINRRARRIRDDGFYVLVVDGDVRIKRVQKSMAGGLTLISDNPRYAPEPILQPEDLVVEGKVFWIGSGI